MLALLYDIHGNLAALDAVLEDAERAGARRFLLGGDYTLFGPYPWETLERLRTLDADWIRGNGERWTAVPGDAPDDAVVQGAIAASREAVDASTLEELAALPETMRIEGALYCHASPASDVRSLWPEPADDEAELLAAVDDERLVFGHTHLPFRRLSERGVELVNPGSVGLPFDGDPRAAYAIVDDAGEVEPRRVEYDHAASARALRERFEGAFVDRFSGAIERGRLEQ